MKSKEEILDITEVNSISLLLSSSIFTLCWKSLQVCPYLKSSKYLPVASADSMNFILRSLNFSRKFDSLLALIPSPEVMVIFLSSALSIIFAIPLCYRGSPPNKDNSVI